MPSSITLTVSHLPTSTSFFLSALQPLHYVYRGRSGQTIGFGPEDSKAQPDFWITQECPGVPAGAAHVAFPAPSHTAVQDFFSAALKAGGRTYGEPALRDQYGYFSAAVIDFDGNSIEAVYRPDVSDSDKENVDSRSLVTTKSSLRAPSAVSKAPTALPTAPSEAPTTASRKSQSPPKGDALDRIFNEARNTANVARNLVDQVRPNLNTNSSPSTDQKSNNDTAIVGTLLGVAAGAALTYAFSNNNSSSSSNNDNKSAQDDTRTRTRPRRPSVAGRSNTAPSYTGTGTGIEHISPRAIESASSAHSTRSSSRTRTANTRYITMEDNDYASTIRPSTNSRARSRRGSLDSGIGMSVGEGSTGSKASKASQASKAGNGKGKGKMKMLEAPPSSWRAGGSLANANANGADGGSKVSTSISRSGSQSQSQSRSGSRSRAGKGSEKRSRRRSSVGSASGSITDDAKTILHIRESVRRVDTFPADARVGSNSHSRSKDSHAKSSRPPSTASKHTSTSKSTIRPETHPLPPSRAATWANGTSEASFATARPTKSVIGKSRDVGRLNVTRDEVRPEDSVSQISVDSVRSRRR